MMTLVRICGEQRHAVERDLLAMHYRVNDIGTKLTVWELLSIVVASPPGTAVYHAETRKGTLTPEAQILSALAGEDDRPSLPAHIAASQQDKVNSLAALPDYGGMKLDAMSVDEFKRLRKEKLEQARSRKAGDTLTLDKHKTFRGR